MVKTKKQHQQKKNDQGGGNQQKKSKTIATANTNTDTNGNRNGNGNVWRAEEEYEIDLLDSRKTATGEIEGCVQWKDANCTAMGKTEWVVSATVCFGTDLLYMAMALPTNSQ